MVRKVIFPISLLFLCLFIACNSEQKTSFSAIHHRLIPPVRMTPDTNKLLLADLMPADMGIDTIWADSNLNVEWNDNYLTLYAENDEEEHIGVLHLRSEDRFLDVPVYHSSKKQILFNLPDTKNQFSEVFLVGDMNAWNPLATELKYDKGNWQTELWLDPGEYGYQLKIDGDVQLDPNNTDTIPNGLGGFNSRLLVKQVADSIKPHIDFSFSDDTIFLHTTVPVNRYLAFWNNLQIPIHEESTSSFLILPEKSNKLQRSYIRVFAQNRFSRSNDILIPLHYGSVLTNSNHIQRSDIHAMRMYFLMVDRFYNGTEDNDMPTDDPDILPIANFMGGDLQGVLKKLRSGYFDSLHMNTIWLSPIPKNPQGAYGLWDKGGVKSEFSSYHGYWPISFTEIDARFGNEEALKELVKIAHQKEKNILLDYVANHVHEEHPVYQAHKDEGWATDLYLEDSTLNTEKWDEHRLTTWFDTFLPTLNLEKQEITEMLSDSIIYWLEEYKVDGFRHDATKHIPLNFWRTLTAKIREYESDNGKEIFQIGETYGTAALISSYLSYGMLDAQFDFNMYDALVNALTNADGSFIKVAEQIKESSQYYGHHHLMGNMSGNQDKTRFMSLASGEVSLEEDTKLAGWTREINKQTDIGFSRLAMLHAFNFSIPGIPVVYYGDEIGMPGGNDPDNRRMMRFQSLSKKELELRDQLSQLTELRKQSLPLQWGNTRILAVDKNVLAILRTYGNEATVIVFNKGANRKILKLDLPFNTGDRCKVKFESDCKIVKDGLQIELNPYSFDFISFKNMKYE